MNESNLEKIITDCFVKLKEQFYDEFTIEEYEDDTQLHILEKRDIVEALPPSLIKIIEITNDSIKSKHRNGLLFYYDYTPQPNNKIEFCGTVSIEDANLIQTISDKFNFKEKEIKIMFEVICKDFTDTTTWEPNEGWSLQFLTGDIETNPEIFYEDWRKCVFWNHYGVPGLSDKFQRTRFEDFNKLYSLEDDPIQILSEIAKSTSQMDLFGMDLELIQKKIAHIQLIPQVPEAIKTTITRVKRLFVYGYFEYSFFTISEHYSLLALESAIKLRYIQSLNGEALLTIPKKNLELKMSAPTHYRIVEFCNNNRDKGWNVSALLVNGEKFPYGGDRLLEWLEEKHLIRKWEKSIFKAGLDMRNSMSHLETTETTMPGAKLLQIIVNEINYIFHKEIQ